MDRRQQKTRKAIFDAFNALLEQKKYSAITVQEIIAQANIGRSTFYAHFETKDHLLKAMCTDIFEHVFSETLLTEKTHDFSEGNRGMEERLTHLLYHLKDNRTNIRGIFACESGELFMDYFKEYLRTLFDQYMDCFDQNVPKDFVLNHLAGSFAEAVRWWMKNHMEPEPEIVAGYYIHLI